jgi:branched-subunit amino acid aminotransferase/4-amino-4-deoxychorismate lyase
MASFLAYQSGQYKALEEVSIALNDAGFVFGVTVTDQCRTHRQQPFRLSEHLQRFRRSCELCQVTHPWSHEELRNIIEVLVDKNSQLAARGTEWSVIWLATPGAIGAFLGEPGGILDAYPQLIIYCFPLPFARFRSYYEIGAEVRVPNHIRYDSMSLLQAKQRSRLSWWLGEQEVKKEHPHAQALLMDSECFATETCSANIVVIRDNSLLSPRFVKILPGISLQTVKELSAKIAIPFIETDITSKDLSRADEALLCSTPYGIAPIGNLNGRQLPVNGPIFERLLQAWNELVGLEIRQQFLSANL